MYFVIEFVDGTDLAHLLHAQRLEPDQALELTLQICEAQHYAHSQGVVHRDIKPANVLITRDCRAKLADFGLARPLSAIHTQLTATNAIMGTPDYMAPEQWQGKADHRADIYALGVMLYELRWTAWRPSSGLASRWEAQAVLCCHGVWPGQSAEEIFQDADTSARFRATLS